MSHILSTRSPNLSDRPCILSAFMHPFLIPISFSFHSNSFMHFCFSNTSLPPLSIRLLLLPSFVGLRVHHSNSPTSLKPCPVHPVLLPHASAPLFTFHPMPSSCLFSMPLFSSSSSTTTERNNMELSAAISIPPFAI